MNRNWFGIFGLCAIAALLLSLANCARNQHLVSITVTPPGATFQAVGSQIQFTAYGTYIHPPAYKTITSQATWAIDSQNLAMITAPGFVTSTSICGSGNLTATMQDGNNTVVGSAFLTGAGIGTSACNQALLTVSVTGTGSVTSNPSGINCPSASCSQVFLLDSTVGLTGTPTPPATTVTWTGCAANGNSCVVDMVANESVTATFQ